MRKPQLGILLAATLTAGLMAGLFAGFAYAVMPGLARSDDEAFVTVMNHINEAILNGWFLSCFMGALLLTIAATVLHWRGPARAALPWIIAGTVLYLVMFLVTSGINVPLNDQLAADGDRAGFETSWVAWNVVRAVAATGSFGCLAVALVRHGRATA